MTTDVIETGEPDFRRAARALADLVAAIEERDSQKGRRRMDFDTLWTRYMTPNYKGQDVTPEQYAAEGWDMARILADLRAWGGTAQELEGQDLADVANIIAAELEARGLGPTAPADVDTITLTTAHAASSYGRPVLVIDGQAYGPADMTPAGVIGAELVDQWAARFTGQLTRRPSHD